MARRALRAAVFALTVTAAAHAGPNDVVALRAASVRETEPDAAVDALLPTVDRLVTEAVQDLGFTVSLEPRGKGELPADDALIERATDSWVVQPSLSREGSGFRVRIVAVRPGTRLMLVRSEVASQAELDVRVAVMMRDVLALEPEGPPSKPLEAPTSEALEASEPRSSGRAVLALNAAVFGGYVGYSIQAASGSSDERLIYPLVALGTGVGLGASMLVADEWNVSVGRAWFISAGLWWPTSSGLLLAAHYDVPAEDRYVYGVVSGTAGVALAVAGIGARDVTDGDALLLHSGGALGMGLGGLTQLFVEGRTNLTPLGGMGYGAAAGTLGTGILATQIDVRASRLLLVDLGATLGALTGAAAASPLLLVNQAESKPRTRAWLGSIFAGSLLGAGIGWYSTRQSEARPASTRLPGLPYALATPEARGARFEAGLVGRF